MMAIGDGASGYVGWLNCVSVCVLALGLGGCVTDADVESDLSATVSTALLGNVGFEDGEVVDGEAKASTTGSVLIEPVFETVIVAPGTSNILAVEVENPDESSDPVASTQIEFQTNKGHVLVNASTKRAISQRRAGGAADAGTPDMADGGVPMEAEGDGTLSLIENAFSVGQDVCDGLCNAFHSIEVHESSVLESGEVGVRSLRQLVLDCRDSGSADKCTDENLVRCALRYQPGADDCNLELYFCTDGVRRALTCDGEGCQCRSILPDNSVMVDLEDVVADPAAHCAALEDASEAVRLGTFSESCESTAQFD